ncbi:MAG TPA: PAS domain S-box protein, partial [Anaerolineaceae bacterium]|nr:PAS domain S-box protein [Anaerolineaceae bacterium]
MRKGPLDAQIENFLAKVFDFIKLNEPDSNELSNDLETLQASISTVLEELQVAAEELHQQNEIILEAQTQLTEETQRYQNLFESAPDAYLVTDKLGIIQQANQAAVNLLNIPPEHIVEKPLTTHLDGESLMKMLHAMSRLISGKDKRVQWESQFSPRRLSPIPVMISAVIQDEGEGKLPHILWLIRNISDTKRAERESRESQARYNTIFNAAPLGILLLDLSGRILDSNHAFHQISGYSEEDMRGFTYPEPFLPEDLASEAAFFLPHVEDEPKQYEVDHRLRRKDGQTIWVHSTMCSGGMLSRLTAAWLA